MIRRLIFPVVMAVFGVAVLLALGIWQVQRLDQKQTALAAIDARIGDVPVEIPLNPNPDLDKYRAVQATGTLTGKEILVLTSHEQGPGYRVISVLDTGSRRVMADLGFVGLEAKDSPRTASQITLTGHLHWPDEVDSWTPAPDGDLWFGRDVAAMAATLDTEPVLIVVSGMSPDALAVTLMPIDTSDIPNDHLGYAITWFGLAFVWAIMSGFFIFRTARAPLKA
jgi:surfeit locus 1 family protein